MIPGLSGTLLSEDALEHAIPDALRGLLGEADRVRAERRLRAWHLPLRRELGPSAGARTIFDRLGVPLFSHLGYHISVSNTVVREPLPPMSVSATLRASRHLLAALVVTGWGGDPAAVWRHGVREAIAHEVRWCFCLTGFALRVVDSLRTYSRRYIEFELEVAIDHDQTFGVLWGLLRAGAMLGTPRDPRPLLERAIEISESQRMTVRSSLQSGVHDALTQLNRAFMTATRRRRRSCIDGSPGPDVFNESLIVIYRILFLLFAEARGLVPGWHPVYRDGYTIESLRQPIEVLPRPRGLWETIQSIARLAHRGCRIGQLQVTPFNGRLFSPIESPLADSVPLDDGAVRQALLALTTRPTPSGRQRIAYSDLGVEQLGGVYEGVLDREPSDTSGGSERRKATGTFYTPRSLTECLVRRTLAPLVDGKSSEEILRLKILDPAMGSGAFLVAACRHLASAYETALVGEGVMDRDDIDERDRADFRRTIAQRCLYGVDINPMAVQLARLSLWLATLAADRPLTFLDHRLRIGNSLIGASAADLARPPRPERRDGQRRRQALPLFDDPDSDLQLTHAVAVRHAIEIEPGHTLAQVRAKERALADLAANQSLARWKEACDAWCGTWFDTEDASGSRRGAAPFSALIDSIFGRPSLPNHVTAPIRARAQAIASRERFFHWSFEFPEVFICSGATGRAAGFDAIVGNPPWEMLRADSVNPAGRETLRQAVSSVTGFAHGSGIYTRQGNGHVNLYQLFLERMLQLLKPAGRLGVVLPSAFASDRGGAALRRALLRTTGIDTLISIENRAGIFPIHRSLRFLLLTSTQGRETTALPCRFGVMRADALDLLPDRGTAPETVVVPRTLIERLSGEDLTIPDIRTPLDVEILSQLAFHVPALGSREGWAISFGRELNATDDKKHFVSAADGARGLPVLEGKMLAPFVVNLQDVVFRISRRDASRLVDPDRTFVRTRLAYRDVASASNRLTLIAALVPPGVVTTHTLFCLKEDLPDDCQRFLCGMFNSFVANYLIRQRVGMHVTTALIAQLPMPRPRRSSHAFQEIAALSRTLEHRAVAAASSARLQALAAHLYGLSRTQFRHVLSTFPLVPEADRDQALRSFCDIVE